MVSKIVIVAFLVVSLTAFSEAIKCYRCKGNVDSGCARGELSAMEVDTCDQFENSCLSTDTIGARSGRSVRRRCGSSNCETLNRAADIVVKQCKICTQDLCNTHNL